MAVGLTLPLLKTLRLLGVQVLLVINGFIPIPKKGELILSNMMMAKASGMQVLPSIGGCDDWGRDILNGVILKR